MTSPPSPVEPTAQAIPSAGPTAQGFARTAAAVDERIRELTPRTLGRSLADCIRELNVFLLGWIGFFWICTGEQRALHGLDAHIRRRLRALVLRHWKRRRTVVRRLIRLEVKPITAWNSIYRGHRSWWVLSHSPAVNRRLRNAYFAERGLVSLEGRWRALHARAVIAPAQLTLALG